MTNESWRLHFLKATTTQLVNNQPYCTQFNDVYFNDDGGIAESKYVFIESNQLSERWHRSENQPGFCIAETGFGTGLNLLTTIQAWQQTNTKPQKLHFISCEKYPLTFRDMQQAHGCFPELSPYSQQLLTIWQTFNDVFRIGFHQFQLSKDVTLTLMFGDATENLSQLNATVDAWFLDGFAPKKNPTMWHQDLFAEVARLSQTGTTLATFTAASQVSKTLNNAGFKVTKTPGFGKKREMITARFFEHQATTNNEYLWDPLPKAKVENKSVTLLGGGIAGMCLAHFFKQANYHVTVIDQHPEPMQGASGNDVAMMMPVITAQYSPESAFYLRAFEHALRFYESDELHSIGIEKQLYKAKHHHWVKSLQHADLPKHIIRVGAGSSALFPMAGYVDTRIVAKRLRANVDQWITAKATHIDWHEEGLWQLSDSANKLIDQAEILVIANGINAQHLMPSCDFSLTAKHGMTTTVQPASGQTLHHIQLADGYVIPIKDSGQWLCGATFDHLEHSNDEQAVALKDDHWQRNLKMWQQLPMYSHLFNAQVIKGYAAIRATTPDHLPLCGPMVDAAQFKLDYHDLHHGRHWQKYPPAKVMNKLYVLNGLGSRGFTSAPILAQNLSAMIIGEPLPLEAELCKIIHPNRFLYRSLKKPPVN